MFIFPVQLTTSRIGNLTRLIHTLLYVMTIHTTVDISIRKRGLERPGLFYQNRLERDFSVLLLRTLAEGRRQQSESIGVALDVVCGVV